MALIIHYFPLNVFLLSIPGCAFKFEIFRKFNLLCIVLCKFKIILFKII